MGVTTTCAEYQEHYPEWVIMRDVLGGERKVKSKGQEYLPGLTGQTIDEYKAYLHRAYFFNATARVRDAFVGMVFRRAPKVEVPNAMQAIVDDITLSGVSLTDFAQNVTSEMLEVTHGGILVDFPTVDLEGRQITVAEAQRANLRPFMRFYRAESIINWRTRNVNGKQELEMVVLQESTFVDDPDDEFVQKELAQYWVLDIDPAGNYRQRLYREVQQETKPGKPAGTTLELVSEFNPVKNGKLMASIPFFILGNPNSLEELQQPILFDLALINLSHYRSTADMEHGLHLTALPTPWASGVTGEAELRIGSSVAWLLGDPAARAGYLEFSGQGLGALRTAIQDKQGIMAALGARILAPEKKAVETAESQGMHRQGEVSVLSALANHIGGQITAALELVRDWANIAGTVVMELNTDYSVSRLDAASIKALLEAVVAGQLSAETFFDTLVDGEAVKTTRTFAEERDLINADMPPPTPANDNRRDEAAA